MNSPLTPRDPQWNWNQIAHISNCSVTLSELAASFCYLLLSHTPHLWFLGSLLKLPILRPGLGAWGSPIQHTSVHTGKGASCPGLWIFSDIVSLYVQGVHKPKGTGLHGTQPKPYSKFMGCCNPPFNVLWSHLQCLHRTFPNVSPPTVRLPGLKGN